jgi:hypothetical protein
MLICAGAQHVVDRRVFLGDVLQARVAVQAGTVGHDAHRGGGTRAGESIRTHLDAGGAVARMTGRGNLRALTTRLVLLPLRLDQPLRRRGAGHQLSHLRVDEQQAPAQRAEHAQREDVDLEQLEHIEVVLVPLDDRAVVHRGVLHRHQQRHILLGDHEAAGMLAEMARLVAQLQAQRDPLRREPRLRIETLLGQRQREPFGRAAGRRGAAHMVQ